MELWHRQRTRGVLPTKASVILMLLLAGNQLVAVFPFQIVAPEGVATGRNKQEGEGFHSWCCETKMSATRQAGLGVKRSKKNELFLKNNSFIYLKNFFGEQAFKEIAAECTGLRLTEEIGSIACGRKGAYVPLHHPLYQLILNDEVSLSIENIVGERVYPADFPLEVRCYPRGSFMGWHKDDILYDKPQYEMVLTIENDSDSVTEWKDKQGRVFSEWTEPGSVMIIKADGPLHQVKPIKRGSRTILKFVYTPTLNRTNVQDDVYVYKSKTSRSQQGQTRKQQKRGQKKLEEQKKKK